MDIQGEPLEVHQDTQVDQAPGMTNEVRAQGFFILLAIFGIAGIVLGFLSLSKNVQSPFVPDSSAIALQGQQDAENTTALQQRDTDGDGLNDFEELYQYNTSPYLADSDSDTVNDKQEIESGNDPNCPIGQDCTGFAITNTSSTADQSVDDLLNTDTTISESDSDASVPLTESGEIDLVQLREVLKASGAPAYIVDSTDDETLLALYQETVAEQGAPAETSDETVDLSQTSVDDASSLALLQQLSSAEIRQLLTENGVDQALLEQINDEELQAIFLDAVQSELGES